jgi:prephenate dehydrogenase
MGRWFSRFFKELNYRVFVYSRKLETADNVARALGVYSGSMEDAEDSDIVLVSVPWDALAGTCGRLGEKMKKGSALVEISAVKTGVEKLAESIPGHLGFLSIHPLFGPNAKGVKGQDIVMVLNRESPWVWTLLEHLEKKGAKLVIMSSRNHDRYMACIQSLHHFAILSLGYALKTCSRKAGFEEISTRSMRATVRNIRSMQRNLDTIAEIQKNNPYSREARELFLRIVKEFAEDKPEEWVRKLGKTKI